LTLGLFSVALAAAPVVSKVYAAPDNDPPPSDSGKKKKKSSELRPGSEQTAFASGYRAAYTAIYDRGEYASAIEQLKALHRDESAAVANLIGYSYRKLGDYKVSQIWYERALKADPDHVKTWQYYGLWQVEQGNRDQAQYHLNRIAALAGTGSEEYRSLAAALEKPPGTGLVY
jgi:tetratricopeptide (TPR) repeat protein